MNILQFLREKMSMTGVYQPVVIKILLSKGGSATKEELARKLAEYDILVVEYYKQILMRWPKMTLTKHGIISYERRGAVFRLLNMPETHSELHEAISFCDAKIKEWIARKQSTEHSSLGQASDRYQVLK